MAGSEYAAASASKMDLDIYVVPHGMKNIYDKVVNYIIRLLLYFGLQITW